MCTFDLGVRHLFAKRVIREPSHLNLPAVTRIQYQTDDIILCVVLYEVLTWH